MCFTLDETVAATARKTGLSTNSVAALFQKLRAFFFEVGLFTDIYDGRDPLEVDIDNPQFEQDLLEFHFARVRDKRGLGARAGEPDYHFAESHWRYHFHVLARQRASGDIHAMMFAHLLELIRLCGPVGATPVNRRAGILAIARQMDQRIAWLERNALNFRPADQRDALRAVRAL